MPPLATHVALPLGAVVLLLTTIPGGLRPAEIAFLLGMGGWLLVRYVPGARPGTPPAPSPWAELALVAVLTVAFGAAASTLLDGDRPYGTDWSAYLRTAIASADGDWERYQRWRGPAYGWASVAANAVTGNLVVSSQLVSWAGATALVPLTWWLTRSLAGPWPALLAAGLLAGWADLRLFAVASTPYTMFAALLTLGAAALGAAVTGPGRLPLGVLAGGALGAATLTDLRGGPTTVALVVGALVLVATRARADLALARRRTAAVVVAGALAAGTAQAGFAALPIELLPLSDQIALQRDLHAREGRPGCGAKGMTAPTLADLTSECGTLSVRRNLARGAATLPTGLLLFVGIVGIGVAYARAGAPFLLLPVLPLLPSLALIAVQHRYLVPVAPQLAALGGVALHGLATAAAPVGRRQLAGLFAAAIVIALAVSWHTWPTGLWARAHLPVSDIDPALTLPDASPYSTASQLLREDLRPKDRVVDCARAGLTERLHPHLVEQEVPRASGVLSRGCARILAAPPKRRTWVLAVVPPDTEIDPAWSAQFSEPVAHSPVVLFRGP
jgi:hypothetical protein